MSLLCHILYINWNSILISACVGVSYFVCMRHILRQPLHLRTLKASLEISLSVSVILLTVVILLRNLESWNFLQELLMKIKITSC